MGKFSAELAGIMDTRDLPIEEVTRGAGVSRSAFFKYKNGSRLPADIQTVRRLVEVLHLNHDEGERLEEAYIIDQLGEYRYRGMMAIEKLLTTPVGSLRVRRPEAELPDLVQGNEPQKLLSGNLTVSVHLLAAISEGVRQGEVTVFGTVSGEEIFRIIGQAKRKHPENEIIHIMAINGSDNASVRDQLYNVERLGDIFITLCSCEGYRPFYYYASLSTLRSLGILQTNAVLTRDRVVCYASDLSSAAIYRDPGTVEMYRNIAAGMRRISSPFAEKTDFADSIKTFSMFNQYPGERFSFMPGLCLTSIIRKSDDILIKNVRHDIPGVDVFLAGYAGYAEGMQGSLAAHAGKHHFLFSGPGIRYSRDTGLLNEFPKEATIPMDQEGTLKLLRRFRQVSAAYDFRVLDDDRFPADNTIALEAIPGQAMISLILPGEFAMRVILIRERGTAALIYDYLSMTFENRAIGGGEREKWYDALLQK